MHGPLPTDPDDIKTGAGLTLKPATALDDGIV